VQVDELSTAAPITHEGVVFLAGTCNSESFVKQLKARLAGGFRRDLVGGSSPSGGLKLILTAEIETLEPLRSDPNVLTGALEAARPNLLVNNWCLAELAQDGRSLYRAVVYVRDGTLGPEAGSDLGTYLGGQLALYRRANADATSSPADPPQRINPFTLRSSELTVRDSPPGYAAWAALSPGLPWLLDDADRWDVFGISASALDVALWMGAALAYNRSADLRNQSSDQPRDTELLASSQDFRDLGHYFLVTAGAIRVAAAVGYLIWPPTLGGPSQVKDGSYSLMWTF
jgi:hypothetical protein